MPDARGRIKGISVPRVPWQSGMPIFLTDEYTDRLKARAVPGAWYERGVGWVLSDPSPRAAAVAIKLFPHLITTHPELIGVRDSMAQDVRPFDHATNFWENTFAGRAVQRMAFAPRVSAQLAARGLGFYDFQRIDLAYQTAVLHTHGSGYIGWGRGMGKTLGAAALIDELDAQRTLVVCPNTAKQSVWGDELARWCPWLTVVVLPNEKRKRERVLAYVRSWGERIRHPHVLVVHYEALAIIAKERSGGTGWKRYGEWDLFVADEARRLANPRSLMTRAAKRIPARHKLALDGSIIQNHAEELFSPLQWLYPDRYSSKWRDWNDRYLDYVDSGYARLCVGVRVERLAQLRDELGRFMVYRRKEDELDLPTRTDETRMVDLAPAQRRVYDDLRDTYVAELAEDERPLTATNSLALLTKLRQVATGLDLVSGSLTDSSKIDLAIDLIEDNPDEAFVVFSWFKAAASALADRLGAARVETFTVTGDTKQELRGEYIRRFQAGEGRVFIGTIATLGESVTLHRASNAIFLDRSWNPAANEQAEDRIYRIGQTQPVTVTHLVARDTVDEERVLPVLSDKQALRRMILGHGRGPLTQRAPDASIAVAV